MRSFPSALLVVVAAIVVSTAVALAREVTVPENVLNPLTGEAEHKFDQAASLFADGDNRAAASQVRAGAALVRLEAGRDHAANQGGLQSSADELDRLAGRIERGEVSSRRELDLAFGRADLALAEHYRAMAREAIANKQHDEAGRWLKAAADAVEDATRWTGEKPPTVQAEARDQVHALETKIRSGANWTYDEGKKGVGYLGTQI
jgi:hypothetical protein